MKQRYTLYVENLPEGIDREALKKQFEAYGKVVDAYIPNKCTRHRSKRFGFIIYWNKKEAEQAMHMMNRKDIEGYNVRINLARGENEGNAKVEARNIRDDDMEAEEAEAENDVRTRNADVGMDLEDEIGSKNNEMGNRTTELNAIEKDVENVLPNEEAIDDSEGPEAPPGFKLFEVPMELAKTLSGNMQRLKNGRNKNKDKKVVTILSPRKRKTSSRNVRRNSRNMVGGVPRGDFNEVRQPNEKRNGMHMTSGMRQMAELIQDLEMMEVDVKNQRFTWVRYNAASKVDGFFVTAKWMDKFPSITAYSRERMLLDHVPIFLDTHLLNWESSPFRTLDYWLSHKGFRTLIKHE
ncbi:hypothetical protein Cgig2_010591 [Carnegiea gigantea]|uniref:RRM domain-containing protein n=1 Tax=Carnegiea gigantea TaxID=171969 RepID=A0A9Q1KTN4_9CARY|nr:hypothetical protein Cgig2_010591 [Carnegiea gigantea]